MSTDRGNNYSSSSTEDDYRPVSKSRRASSNNSDGSNESEQDDDELEICQIGDQACSIPHELFSLPDLKNIMSLDTWNFCLTEEERESLMLYLPSLDQDGFQRTLKELLGGKNFYFGSPLSKFFEQLKGGFLSPPVAQYMEGLKYIERKEHYHILRDYHDGMVNYLLEMQKLWEDYPNAELDERLQIWNSWKTSKVKPDPSKLSRKKFSALSRSKLHNEGPKGVLKVKGAVPIEASNVEIEMNDESSAMIPSKNLGQPGPKGVLKVARKAHFKESLLEDTADINYFGLPSGEANFQVEGELEYGLPSHTELDSIMFSEDIMTANFDQPPSNKKRKYNGLIQTKKIQRSAKADYRLAEDQRSKNLEY